MKLYRTEEGGVVEEAGSWFRLGPVDWDELIGAGDLAGRLRSAVAGAQAADAQAVAGPLLAPLGSQEVWAAGVTYYRSRTARMAEAEAGGGGSFYDRVYEAERPELFMKAGAERVVGSGQPLRLRRDSSWVVPEPELTLVVDRAGRIVGCTIGNDLSCRDIEGQNPLYLPQAKTFDGCASVGPAILVTDTEPAGTTRIELEIRRGGQVVLEDRTELGQMKRGGAELVSWLYRETSFPRGCLLMTGTGIVPPDEFGLRAGDEIRITIEPIGTLVNRVH